MAIRTIAGFMISPNAIDASKIAGGAVTAAALAPDALAGHAIHDAVFVCTDAALPDYTGTGTAVLTAAGNGQLNVDGQPVNANDRVLVTKQAAGLAVDNLIYKVQVAGDVGTAWVLVRDNDSDTGPELPEGSTVYVRGGAKNAGTSYRLQSFNSQLGTGPLLWDLDEEGLTPGRFQGAGDGNNLNFDLLAKGVLGVIVYVGGVIQPTNIYTIDNGGAGGNSRLVFNGGNAPANLASVDVEFFTRL